MRLLHTYGDVEYFGLMGIIKWQKTLASQVCCMYVVSSAYRTHTNTGPLSITRPLFKIRIEDPL